MKHNINAKNNSGKQKNASFFLQKKRKPGSENQYIFKELSGIWERN
jgi:hypothetical protein